MLNYNLQLTDNRNERFDFLFVASSYKRTRGRRKRRNGPPVNGESNERGTNCGPNDRQMDRSISRITISRIGRRGNDLARRWPVNDVKFHPLSLNCSTRKKISPNCPSSIFNLDCTNRIQFFNLHFILYNNKIF